MWLSTGLSLVTILTAAVHGQSTTSCAAPSPSSGIRPSVASGYRLQVVASGLAKPRGLALDRSGNLLVVEQAKGVVSSHTLQDRDGCVTVSSSKNLTSDLGLNHGIVLSQDGRTLYVSNPTSVYSFAYDAAAQVVSNQQVVVTNMTTTDHTTRTLLLPQSAPGLLVVTRGSTSNLDFESASLDSGHSQIKAYNLTNATGPYDFNTAGLRLGWGVRNEVGIAEHPVTGGIYGVENSADQIFRYGVDVHQNNPAEELNFFGYLNGRPYTRQGDFFGYPWCLTAWDVRELPNNNNLTTGQQFAINATPDLNDQNRTDAFCAAQVAPRLSFQAHMAPLDIKFNTSGREAWITFHGSWDRTQPVGYKVSVVSFNQNGDPVAPPDSMTAAVDIISNMDNSLCPNKCFRPVGLVFDTQGRILMSSDATGEIYMITKTNNAAANTTASATSAVSSTASSTSSGTQQTSSSAASDRIKDSTSASWVVLSWFSLILAFLC